MRQILCIKIRAWRELIKAGTWLAILALREGGDEFVSVGLGGCPLQLLLLSRGLYRGHNFLQVKHDLVVLKNDKILFRNKFFFEINH